MYSLHNREIWHVCLIINHKLKQQMMLESHKQDNISDVEKMCTLVNGNNG